MTAKPIKFQLMLSEDEAERLDIYAAENQLKSRAEAIRRLCEIGLELDRQSYSIKEILQRIVSSANRTARSIVGITTRLTSAKDEKQQNKIYDKGITTIATGIFEALELAGDAITCVNSIVATLDPSRSTEAMNDALKSAKLLQPKLDEEDDERIRQTRETLKGHQNIHDRLRKGDDN